MNKCVPSKLAFAALIAASIACPALANRTPAQSVPALHVQGNQILDASGNPVRLRGVNVACMEWTSDGEGHVWDTVKVAIQDWHSNIIRLPMSQDRWFGKAPEQTDGGAAYRELVKSIVGYTAAHGCYILLDLHWNDCDQWGKNIGQHVMPDTYSLQFWTAVAGEYKNMPNVLFDLYNEPHDTTWDIWLKGGNIEEKRGVGARQGQFTPVKYRTPGMQSMLDTVRATGARNVVVCGGLDWAYDLSGFLKGYQLQDPTGNGIIYACHTYPIKGDTVEKWTAKLDAALPHFPVIMSEFGAQNRGATVSQPNPWVQQTLDVMQKRNCNWIAWDLHPSAGPTLIKDWTYAPTPSFGGLVKQALGG